MLAKGNGDATWCCVKNTISFFFLKYHFHFPFSHHFHTKPDENKLDSLNSARNCIFPQFHESSKAALITSAFPHSVYICHMTFTPLVISAKKKKPADVKKVGRDREGGTYRGMYCTWEVVHVIPHVLNWWLGLLEFPRPVKARAVACGELSQWLL